MRDATPRMIGDAKQRCRDTQPEQQGERYQQRALEVTARGGQRLLERHAGQPVQDAAQHRPVVGGDGRGEFERFLPCHLALARLRAQPGRGRRIDAELLEVGVAAAIADQYQCRHVRPHAAVGADKKPVQDVVVFAHRSLDHPGDVAERVVGDQTAQRQGVIGRQPVSLAGDALADVGLDGVQRRARAAIVHDADGDDGGAGDDHQRQHHGANELGPQPSALAQPEGRTGFLAHGAWSWTTGGKPRNLNGHAAIRGLGPRASDSGSGIGGETPTEPGYALVTSRSSEARSPRPEAQVL